MGYDAIRHLAFLAGLEDYGEHIKETILLKVDLRFFSGLEEAAFSHYFISAKDGLSASNKALDQLLELRLATEALVLADTAPDWATRWLCSQTTIGTWFGLDMKQAVHDGRWAAVPVVLAGHGQAHIRTFVVGFVAETLVSGHWPSWAESLMDSAAKTAIETAMVVARSTCHSADGKILFCYPLTVPNNTIQIEGESLALPLALGFRGLLLNRRPNERLVATGCLKKDGHIRRVGFAGEKLAEAAGGFRGLILPGDNLPVPNIEQAEWLPVSDFEQAAVFWDLYAPGRADLLMLFSDMLADPDCFVSNCDRVPSAWLRWAQDNHKTDALTQKLAASPRLFLRLGDRLQACTDRFRLGQAEAIQRLVPSEILDSERTTAPLAAFRWHTWSLALANHRGDVARADKSVRQATPLVRRAMAMDIESATMFFTHLLVSFHNRYVFEPDPPPQTIAILTCLEQIYQQRLACGCRTYITLGRLYGTLAQHYGFCGPDYLESTERYAKKARYALGEGTVPEYKEEWLRQLNYLTYAYLDAGRLDEAGQSLFGYLEIEGWADLWPLTSALSAWQHALLARFLADTRHPNHAPAYLAHVVRLKDALVKNRHPWQLWLWNLGRIALEHDGKTLANTLFRQSLGLCQSLEAGPTIQMMSLLPLSGLWRLGGLTKRECGDINTMFCHAVNQLAGDHFRAIGHGALERDLGTIWDAPEKLFPFTYR